METIQVKKKSTYQGAGFGCLGAILVVLFMVFTTHICKAQHNPFEVPAKLIGEVSTLELYHETTDWEEHLIFYSYESGEEWASVRMGGNEIPSLYEVMAHALRGGVYKFGIRQTEFEFNAPAFGRGTVKISDPYGRSVEFKITRKQLKKLFNIEK